jgi:hypothetical protein
MASMVQKYRTSMVLLCLLNSAVFAHKPIWSNELGIDANTAIQLIDPNVSQVVYRPLPAGCHQIWTTCTASGNFNMYLQIGVPVLDRLKNFRPSLVLIGPGLPDANLPFKIPRGYGATVIDTNSAEPRFFHEPFTGTDSWILASKTITLPKSGRFYVVAYDPKAAEGKLWMAVGQKERFGIADFFTFGQTKKRVRTFHELDTKSSTDVNNTRK